MKSLEEENEETDWRCRTCRYHFVLSKAAADQEAGRFALKPSHRIVYPILTWLFTDNTELINAALD